MERIDLLMTLHQILRSKVGIIFYLLFNIIHYTDLNIVALAIFCSESAWGGVLLNDFTSVVSHGLQ
jgi:hypothetical protein